MKIKNITKCSYSGKVYNIGTLPNHNYFANNILVHNCYQDAKESGKHADNLVERLKGYFGSLDKNQKPFQVAIGGGGEPTLHPDFIEALKALKDIDIVPNYTTNGMHLTDEIIDATKKYCGGVAVSAHPQLVWGEAVRKMLDAGIHTSIHCIMSDKLSIDRMFKISEIFPEVNFIVVLPLQAVGRCKEASVDYDYFFERLDTLSEDDYVKFAYGAMMYNELATRKLRYKPMLYEPEMFSAYWDMVEDKWYASSFSNEEIAYGGVTCR